jgi:hypothetical protein
MIIEVPDVLPANFARPSCELLAFISELQEACVRINEQFRNADGRELFGAFIRNGVNTVFCIRDGITRPIKYYSDEPMSHGPAVNDEDISETWDEETTDAVALETVVMDCDRPGNWVVARLYAEGLKECNNTLRSSDFEMTPEGTSKAEILFTTIIKHLANHFHTVPKTGR